MNITCGIDWAEGHHDVAPMDDRGTILAHARIDTGPGGFAALLRMIAQQGGCAQSTPIGIETDKNLLVVALACVGFSVYPINPRAVARYRERFGQAGGKSDAADAAILADILRTDRHQHRQLPAVSESAAAVKALARQHQEAVWALHQTTSRLRSVLLEFYPQALVAFPHLTQRAALTVLAAAPTPGKGRRLTRARIVALLRKCGRRNDPSLVEHIHVTLRQPALRQPEPVEAALGITVMSEVAIIMSMLDAVALLEDAMTAEFEQPPLAPILRSVPGLGPVLAARVLAEVGDDPLRFPTAAGLRAYAGTAPVTRASGRSSYVKARKVGNKPAG